MKSYFDKETEQKLLQLGRKKFVKTLTILWCVLGAWSIYTIYSGRSWNNASILVCLLLCLLPFFPFRVQKILFSRTFYGTVESARVVPVSRFVPVMTGKGKFGYSSYTQRERETMTAEVVFRGDHGEKQTVNYTDASVLARDLYYQKDDRVLVIRGLKYPVKYPIPETEEYICPVCGNFIKPGKRCCHWCKADFE